VVDVIAEDPCIAWRMTVRIRREKRAKFLEDELQSGKRVPFDAAVRAIDEAIGNGRLVRTRSTVHDGCGLADRAIDLVDGARRPSLPEADHECTSRRPGDLANRPQIARNAKLRT